MSVGTESLSDSQYLSSSQSSLNASKRTSSEISKTYKHASQLYLTRRLAEAHEALQPVIKPPQRTEDHAPVSDEPAPLAIIALASTSHRIKIWSLYITLLNAIVDSGPDDGRRDFGSKEYGQIVRAVQTGDIWDQVVRDGYQGREGSVDAEVVYNLSNLLLAQAPNQQVNQSRLEVYLSASANASLDISAHLNNSLSGKRSYMNGTSTPKDLSSRIKILELFTLHVLPRNDEWEYARTFIAGSDVLDEERREAFLQTLEELQVAKEQETGYTSVEEDYGQEPEVIEPTPMEEPYPEREPQGSIKDTDRLSSPASDRKPSSHHRSSSEIDYGIEEYTNRSTMTNGADSIRSSVNNDSTPPSKPLQRQPSPAKPTTTPVAKPPAPTTPARHPQPPSSKPARKSTSKAVANSSSSSSSSSSVLRQARHMLLLLRTFTSNISTSLVGNPTAMFRTLMFLFAFLVLMSRRELRERVKRVMENGWAKVRGTIGMGVKVSYV